MKPRYFDLYPCCPGCCCPVSRKRQFNRSIDPTTGECSMCQGRGLAALPLSELFNSGHHRKTFEFTHRGVRFGRKQRRSVQ